MVCWIKNTEGFYQISFYTSQINNLTGKPEYVRSMIDGAVISEKGAGKTTFFEEVRDVGYDLGIKSVSLTDAKKNLELCTCLFLPEDKQHLEQLKYTQTIAPRTFQLNILTPFSYNIINHSQFKVGEPMPPIILFTISIKKLTKRNLSVIFGVSEKNSFLNLVMNTINELGNDDGLPQLFTKLKERIRKNKIGQTYKGKKINLISSIHDKKESSGTETDIGIISDNLIPLVEMDRFIASENCPYNLDKIIIKLLNDNKTFDQYSPLFIKDEKAKDICTDCINETIFQAIESQKIYCDIQKLVDEILDLLPDIKEGHKLYLAENTANRWIKDRNMGRFLCGTLFAGQSIAQCSNKLFEIGMKIFIGSGTSKTDLGKALKFYKLESGRTIEGLNNGEWAWLGHTECQRFKILLPRHAHKVRDYNFFDKYIQTYPERLKIHQQDYDNIINIFKQEDEKDRNYVEEHNQREKERIDKQIEEEELKKELAIEQEQKSKENKVVKSSENPAVQKIIEKLYCEDNEAIEKIGEKLKEEYKIKGWYFNKIKNYLKEKNLLKVKVVKEISMENDIVIEKVKEIENPFIDKMFEKKKKSELPSYEDEEQEREEELREEDLINEKKQEGGL